MEISIDDLNAYQLPSNCFNSHYKIISYLGQGSFGKVFKAREISTGRVIAVKKMCIDDSKSKYNKTIKEINLLKNLDHPNIVKYYDYFQEENYIYLMMEYLDGCTLKQYIQNNQNITEDDARIIIKQLLTALSYLHYTCDICHRDIKPENIMFKEKDSINNLKLLDFGLSLDSFESKKYLENCGTLVYMAPELIKNIKYTKQIDVWSVGIILYMLLMKGKNPFYNKGDAREKIINNIMNNNVAFTGENKSINPISKMGKHLINKLLKKNPLYRYSIKTALEHPWITMNKFDKMPLTIYDKANIDENAEKLKIFLMISIFLFYQKKEIFKYNDKSTIFENSKGNKSDYFNIDSDYSFNYRNNKIKKYKNIKNQKNIMKKFDMKEYEKMVNNSNKLYHLKFIEDREIMFNPKLSSDKINNNIVSLLLKKIKENKKEEDYSINNNNNTIIKDKNQVLNKYTYLQKNSNSGKKSLFNDEQKNLELLEKSSYIAKIKTPYKIRNNLINSSRTNIPKMKLQRRFSAVPRIVNNNNNINKKIYKDKSTSLIKNLKDKKIKKELDYKNKNDIKLNKQYDHKKNMKMNSTKNLNVNLYIDKSININISKNKWNLPYKNINMNKNLHQLFSKRNNNKNFIKNNDEKYIINKKLLSLKHEKEKNLLKKNNILLSITEQSQKNNNKKSKRKLPAIV